MANMLDYLAWRGDIPLSCAPFGDVDNLILSEFAYLLLEHAALPREGTMTVRDVNGALENCPEAFGMLAENNRRMLQKMAEGERFSSAEVRLYRHETDLAQEKQFAAVTLLLGDGTAFVAYRGTDNTIVGWKEDFNLSFVSPVPAQASAVAYLCEAAGCLPGGLRVGGHSKGGNLAVYAAANCPQKVQDRILRVYSNDGPGMDEKTFSSDGYARISQRIGSIVPQSSVIGMLLQHQESYTVIKSRAFSIFQHNPFSWQVTRDGFEIIEALRPGSLYLDSVLKKWLANIDTKERMVLIDTLFAVLTATKAATVNELTEGVMRNAVAMLEAAKNIDAQTRRRTLHIMGALFSAALDGRGA